VVSWYGVKRFFRDGKSSAFLVVGLAMATALFASPIIASDAALAGGLMQTLESTPAHMTLSTTVERFPNVSEYRRIAEEVAAIDGVSSVEIIAHRCTYDFTFAAISPGSPFYSAMTVEVGPPRLGENETYIVTGSPSTDEYWVGSTVEMTIIYQPNETSGHLHYPVNLTVVGQVSLPPVLRRIALMDFSIELFPEVDILEHQVDLFLVDWNATIAPLIDFFSPRAVYFSIGTRILIGLDLASVVNPYDLAGSCVRMEAIEEDIKKAAEGSEMSLENWISEGLDEITEDFSAFTGHILLSVLPSMFVALYTCKIVGGASIHLRRREILLLSSRGVSTSMIRRSGLVESLLVSAAGCVFGMALSFTLLSMTLGTSIAAALARPSNLLAVFVFAGVAGGLEVVLPVWQITSEDPENQGLEGRPPIRGLRSHLIVWLVFLAGAYRVAAWGVGFDPRQMAEGVTSFAALILFNAWIFVHDTLTWVAPIFCLYGASRIVTEEIPQIRSLAAAGAGKLFGEVGLMASKFSGRRISRTAALILILSLAASYGVWSVGFSASEQEHFTRSAYIEVGADIRVYLEANASASSWASTISNLDGVYKATPEIGLNVETGAGPTLVYAVDPSAWGSVAFYERYWFQGTSCETALAEMAADNMTIVLDRRVASMLGLGIGDSISIKMANSAESFDLRIIGLFCRSLPYSIPRMQLVEASWSLVPLGLLEGVNCSIARNHIIGRLAPGVPVSAVEEELAGIGPEVRYVKSAFSVAALFSESLLLRAPVDVALVTAGLGVLFSSLGVLSVTVLALKEHERDLRLLCMRGFTPSWLSRVLAAEFTGIIALALPLGLLVGLAWVIGSVDALNNPLWLARSMQIAGYQVTFTTVDLLWVGLLIISMVASVIGPCLYAVYRVNVDVERMGEEEWL